MTSQSGNAQALPTTNQDFLKAIFGNSWYLAHVTGFAGDPQDVALPRAVWEGGSAGSWVLSPHENNYFAVSLFTGRRDQKFFDKLIVLAVDDVGVKVSADKLGALPVKPSFRIETSPGNEQWGYVLAEPVTNLAMATALIDAMARYAGTNDARGVTRYIRLPVGSNGKSTAHGWHCRLLELDGKISPEGQTALALVLSVALTGSEDDPSPNVVPGPGATRRSYDDLAEHDRWFRAMRKLGMVLGGPRNSAMGRGYDIRCPWVDEHTGRAETGAFYTLVQGRFKCQHGHCVDRKRVDLPARLDELLRQNSPDPAKPVRLVDVVFDELPGVPSGGARTLLTANPGADIYDADPTQDGLAQAFCDRYHGMLRFNRTTGHWHVWDRHTWTPDGSHIALTWARQVTRDFRRSLERDIRALGGINAIAGIDRMARNDPRLSVTLDAFDPDPWRAGTPGDEVLLATGAMAPPLPANLITRRLSVIPAPRGAQAPVWDEFIWDTFDGDIELIDFVHRLFGYCLSGDVSAEIFAFLYGTGGNGKGVLVHTVSAIAGDYAWKIDARVLMRRKDEGHETDIAQLAGKRLVITSELPDSQSFNLTRLKNLTGNEGLLGARYMRKDHFQFRPVHKLILVGNHKPQLDHVDDAIRRRLVLIPFLRRPPSPDPTLKARLVPEYPAILRRLLDGCAEVHDTLASGQGFTSLVPASVNAAGSAYLAQQDTLLLWINERCEVDMSKRVLVSHALEDFRGWCAAEGRYSAYSKQDFRDAVLDKAKSVGITISYAHTNKGWMLNGVTLAE